MISIDFRRQSDWKEFIFINSLAEDLEEGGGDGFDLMSLLRSDGASISGLQDAMDMLMKMWMMLWMMMRLKVTSEPL